MADAIAGKADCSIPGPHTYICDANQIHDAITPPSTWQWHEGNSPFHGSLHKRAQQNFNNTNFFNIANRDIRSVSMPTLPHVRHGTVRL